MKIKLSEFSGLYTNLLALDGFDRVVEIEGKSRVVFERHSYGEKFTWNRVKNLRVLRGVLQDIEELRVGIAKKHLDDPGDNKVPPQNEQAFAAEYNKALQAEDDIKGLLKFSVKDLNLYDPKSNPSGNKIASTILDGLGPLLDS